MSASGVSEDEPATGDSVRLHGKRGGIGVRNGDIIGRRGNVQRHGVLVRKTRAAVRGVRVDVRHVDLWGGRGGCGWQRQVRGDGVRRNWRVALPARRARRGRAGRGLRRCGDYGRRRAQVVKEMMGWMWMLLMMRRVGA